MKKNDCSPGCNSWGHDKNCPLMIEMDEERVELAAQAAFRKLHGFKKNHRVVNYREYDEFLPGFMAGYRLGFIEGRELENQKWIDSGAC